MIVGFVRPGSCLSYGEGENGVVVKMTMSVMAQRDSGGFLM